MGGGVGSQADLDLSPWSEERPRPEPHLVFVKGGSGIVFVWGTEDLATPTASSRPLGNSKKTSCTSGGFLSFNLPERPGDGLSKVRQQIQGGFTLPVYLIENCEPHWEVPSKFLQKPYPGLVLKQKTPKSKPHTSHLQENSLSPSRIQRTKGHARVRGLGSPLAGGCSHWAVAVSLDDGRGNKQGV